MSSAQLSACLDWGVHDCWAVRKSLHVVSFAFGGGVRIAVAGGKVQQQGLQDDTNSLTT